MFFMPVLEAKKTVTIESFFEVEKRDFLSKEDLEFWKGKPPKEIILATGSVRKAIMLFHLLYGLGFYDNSQSSQLENGLLPENEPSPVEINNPPELQEFFNQNIHNGDGHLAPGIKVQLGHFHGVPVYVENKSGETANNNPVEQAENKALTLARHYKEEKEEYRGIDVIVISTDAVSQSSVSDLPMGKPMNEPDFPKGEGYDSQEVYQQAIIQFEEQYKQKYYPEGALLTHTTGMAVVRTGGIDADLVMLSTTTTLNSQVFSEKLKIYSDCAGGGVDQQKNWNKDLDGQFEGEVFRSLPEYFGYSSLAELIEYRQSLIESRASSGEVERVERLISIAKSYLKWTIYCQIAGMPWWALERSIEGLAEAMDAMDVKDYVEKLGDSTSDDGLIESVNVADLKTGEWISGQEETIIPSGRMVKVVRFRKPS